LRTAAAALDRPGQPWWALDATLQDLLVLTMSASLEGDDSGRNEPRGFAVVEVCYAEPEFESGGPSEDKVLSSQAVFQLSSTQHVSAGD
jgi:hypothetical protein